jgi:hypothetical protein
LIDALGSAASCVVDRRLASLTSHFEPNESYTLRFSNPPASLRAATGGPSGLLFDVQHRFAIVEGSAGRAGQQWQATTRMYEYRLLDHDGRELLVYHWQPGDEFMGPDLPHLHVSAALNAQTSAVEKRSIDLDKLHLATGRVSLASVVRMLITEFGIAPRHHDWAEALDRTEQVFQAEMAQPA